MSEQQPPPWPPTPPVPGAWAPQDQPPGAPDGHHHDQQQPSLGHVGRGSFEQPPHPALVQPGSSHVAHLSPHAASAGPKDGSRGATLFAVAVALLVIACLAGALVLAASA